MTQRESVTVLEECIELQKRKSEDYQNPNSNIVQAMHYRRGVSSIHDMIHQKLLRAQSLLEPLENGDTVQPNFESLEDTYKDLINYASFAVSYLRGKMEGQGSERNMLNQKIKSSSIASPIEEGDPIVTVYKNIIGVTHKGMSNFVAVEDVGDRIEQDFADAIRDGM